MTRFPLFLLFAVPPEWMPLIGEYGTPPRVFYILERGGKLMVRSGANEHEITLTQARNLRAANPVVTPEGRDTFRIVPLRPVEELRREALQASPPVESGDFRPADLVDPAELDSTILLDIRYASDNNFLGTPMYTEARARLQRPAAEALLRVSRAIHRDDFGLLIYDAYRPWYVTKMFWDAVPEADHKFVADPATGSKHNRGCAVDLTLYSLKTKKPVRMTGGYDEMSDRSLPHYPGGTSEQRWHRDYLRQAMEKEGFTVYESEWWHFDYRDWPKYRIGVN